MRGAHESCLSARPKLHESRFVSLASDSPGSFFIGHAHILRAMGDEDYGDGDDFEGDTEDYADAYEAKAVVPAPAPDLADAVHTVPCNW